MVQQRRPEKETFFEGRLSSVQNYLYTLFFAEVYVIPDLLAVRLPDNGGKLAVLLAAGADFHGGGRFFEFVDQFVGDLTDGDGNAAGQAPFAGVTIGRGDHVLHRFIEHRVGHHDHGVLRPRERLNPLAVRRAVSINVLGDRLRAHERDGFYAGMLQNGVHRLPCPVHGC